MAHYQSAGGVQRAVGILPTDLTIRGTARRENEVGIVGDKPTELTVRAPPDGSSGRMPEAPARWLSRPWPPTYVAAEVTRQPAQLGLQDCGSAIRWCSRCAPLRPPRAVCSLPAGRGSA